MSGHSPRTRKRSLTKSQTNLLRRYLRDRDAPCPFCDFNLRDYEGEHCPECHEPLSYTKMKRGLPRPESKYKFIDDAFEKFGAALERDLRSFTKLPRSVKSFFEIASVIYDGLSEIKLFVWFAVLVLSVLVWTFVKL